MTKEQCSVVEEEECRLVTQPDCRDVPKNVCKDEIIIRTENQCNTVQKQEVIITLTSYL